MCEKCGNYLQFSAICANQNCIEEKFSGIKSQQIRKLAPVKSPWRIRSPGLQRMIEHEPALIAAQDIAKRYHSPTMAQHVAHADSIRPRIAIDSTSLHPTTTIAITPANNEPATPARNR